MHQGILYKIKSIYDQKAYRLCLPEFLGREIFHKLHHRSEAHITFDNLKAIFDTSFYTPNSHRNVYKQSTSGDHREFENDLTVGAIWCSDVAHLPRSKNGFKYVMLFSDRITNFISGIALKNITSNTVSQAFENFMSIFPPLNIPIVVR